MPGNGKAKGAGNGKEHGRGNPRHADRGGDVNGSATEGRGRPESPGRSEWAPGQLKRDAGEPSARDFAPGHGGEPPGRRGAGEEPEEIPGQDERATLG